MHVTDLYDDLTARLRASGDWVWPTTLRLIMFAEFWAAGQMKLGASVGESGAPGWFAGKEFPMPFDWLPAGLNWNMVAYGEVIFSVLLLLGLFTRFAAFSLLVITTIAIVSTHWPAEWSSLAELWQGYAITNKGFGNYRVPLLFMLILLPLIFHGGGKLSIDTLLRKLTARAGDDRRIGDLPAIGLALLILAVPFIYLIPGIGFTLLALGIISIAIPRFT
ncbi:MAG: DoxX family protein [Gammaproteobacteria bacterium]|jgi:putative oxidoreductase|nr:DoxX family protein [Gammaproteobacteria bacterium]